MIRWYTGVGLLLAALANTAAAAPGHPVSPYNATARPLAPGPLIRMQVTDKKKTYVRGFLDQNQYTQIKNGAMEIMKRFPPKKNFYVTLGRSPTAIGAFFDNLGEHETDLHVNLPASNLRDGQIQGFEAAWFAHIEKFIPKRVLEGDQKIVLIDRSTTGATLLKVKSIFDQYFAAKGQARQVEVIAFARAKRAVPINFVDITASPELVDMNQGNYDGLAKYPWYYVGQSNPQEVAQPLPQYSNFKLQMRERMTRDAELHQAFAK